MEGQRRVKGQDPRWGSSGRETIGKGAGARRWPRPAVASRPTSRSSSTCSWGGRRHDGLGAAAAWATTRCNDAQATRTLARRERLRHGSRDPRPEATPRTSSTSMLFSDRNMSQPLASTCRVNSSSRPRYVSVRFRLPGAKAADNVGCVPPRSVPRESSRRPAPQLQVPLVARPRNQPPYSRVTP